MNSTAYNLDTDAPHVWARPSPPYASTFSGGLLEFKLSDGPSGGIPLADVRALHGAVCELIGQEKVPYQSGKTSNGHPDIFFLLWPYSTGWALYSPCEATIKFLAGKARRIHVFQKQTGIAFASTPVRLRAPGPVQPGIYQTTVKTLTPIVVRNHKKTTALRDKLSYHSLNAACFRGSLVSNLAHTRLGADVPQDSIAIRVVRESSEPTTVNVGGFKWGARGVVHGVVGEATLQTNAVGLWLLECAKRIGMGGRVSIGFGRVDLSDTQKIG